MKRNITFSFDENLLASVLAISAERRTSANELVRHFFEHVDQSGIGRQGAMNGNLKNLFDYSMGTISRPEARQRLGVSDASLTEMLVASGFPPPRATEADEQAMVARAAGVPLARG